MMATNVGAADSNAADAAERRLKMVNGQLRTSDVTDNTLLAAFLTVPRESYVAPAFAKLAFLDQPVPAAGAKTRKLMAPRTLGLLLQAAEVNPGDRALEVGGGSGYGAALLAQLGAVTTLVESDPDAAAAAETALSGTGVSVVRGDLGQGAPGKAPFDLILVNGAFDVFPNALIAQLSENGRLVALDSREDPPRGVLIRKSGHGVSERPLFDASGDVLPGLAKAPAFAL
jgi:protein-L-isoaspartate(D-aspartate) O-methyltransferase